MLLAAVTHVVVDEIPSSGTNWLAYLPIVTAIVAACSAVFSAMAVRHAKEIWKRGLLPVLAPLLDQSNDGLHLMVANVSKAVAADVGWAALWVDRYTEGRLPDRAIAPDTTVEPIFIMYPLGGRYGKKPPDPVVIVWCRDLDGALHVWSHKRRHKRFDPQDSMTPRKLLASMAGDSANQATYYGRPGAQVGTI